MAKKPLPHLLTSEDIDLHARSKVIFSLIILLLALTLVLVFLYYPIDVARYRDGNVYLRPPRDCRERVNATPLGKMVILEYVNDKGKPASRTYQLGILSEKPILWLESYE
jgi:hypothetical protein